MAAQQFQGKRIPWQDVINYDKLHKETVAAQVKLQKHADVDKLAQFENDIPAHFFTLYQQITKILKDNEILEDIKEEQKGDDKQEKISRTVLKIEKATTNIDQIKSNIGSIPTNVDQLQRDQLVMENQPKIDNSQIIIVEEEAKNDEILPVQQNQKNQKLEVIPAQQQEPKQKSVVEEEKQIIQKSQNQIKSSTKQDQSKPSGSQVISALINKYFTNSKCATQKEKEFLLKLLGNKQLVTILLYSGSIHGWYAKDFHSRSDQKNSTISLFKVKDGDCIGGYTKSSWKSSSSGEDVGDSHAMLFNLSQEREFKNTGTGEEIYCDTGYGPYYGNAELVAYQPFNGNGNCESWANTSAYKIPIDKDGKNMLTNKEGYKFTITELEVWQVTEEKK